MRISDKLLVQRVDDDIVVLSTDTGEEVGFPVEATLDVISALTYLAGDWYDADDDGRNAEDARTSQ